jgi:signal transduction histidine kinase
VADFDLPADDIRPTREGLPPNYRMRADRHYVDLLASRTTASRDRLVPIASIEAPDVSDVPALVPLIDSVKQHGVLQPLLVQERGDSMRVISGQRRLAAAIAAGLREVPCVVHAVDDEEALKMRAASNLPATPAPADPVPSTADAAQGAGDELARALAAATSLADLLTGSISDLSRGVVGSLLRAELWRASTTAQAARIVRNELTLVRGAVPVAALIDKVVQGFAAERRMRHVEFTPQIDLPAGHIVIADERLLFAAVAGAVSATLALLEGVPASRLALIAGLTTTRQLTLVVSQDHVPATPAWIERAFDVDWRERPGGTAVVLGMATLQRVARVHGGEATVASSPRGSRVGLTIPAGA